MNLSFLLSLLINIARPYIKLAADPAHAATERALTVPEKDRLRLYKGMSTEDVAHAEELYRKHVDATADYVVFVASRGEIEED